MLARWGDIERMFEAMGLLQGKLDNMYTEFDRSYGYPSSWGGGTNFPRTNLVDTGEKFELTAEVPGLGKEDLNVKIQGNYLEISGERAVAVPQGYKVHRSERAATSFSRSLTLPADVDAEKVAAVLKDGMLRLSLPKAEAAKPRKISIN